MRPDPGHAAMTMWWRPRSSNYLPGWIILFSRAGELEVDLFEGRLADREMPKVDVVLERPRGDPLRGHHRFLGRHKHAIALERPSLARNVGQVTQRPLRRQREADLGRSQVTATELLGPSHRD